MQIDKEIMRRKKDKNQLYPVYFDNKTFFEEDCDGVFVSFYQHPQALMPDMSVYVGEDIFLYPDGTLQK